MHDRGFWQEVDDPELGRSFIYPGEYAIYKGSPWRIPRKAPLIGEHNEENPAAGSGCLAVSFRFWRENRVISGGRLWIAAVTGALPLLDP
ncbi:MAG: hypothetical protein JO095_08215 [Alphaproteobacteria bacterium]|nr:hypothetical protein [Alphaproteobacteria bacterium]